MSARNIATVRLAASVLLAYPDERWYVHQLRQTAAVVEELPARYAGPLRLFIAHAVATPPAALQEHFVATFDMRRKASPYLSYWTDGDTRNRGRAILRFKQAYLDSGHDLGNEELPDHLAVVLEFAAVGDRVTGEALLAEHSGPINLLRDALASMESPYAHVLEAVTATLPSVTPEVRARMVEIAAYGPPVEQVGLEPFPTAVSIELTGGRR